MFVVGVVLGVDVLLGGEGGGGEGTRGTKVGGNGFVECWNIPKEGGIIGNGFKCGSW